MASEKLQIILDALWKGKNKVAAADRDIKGLNKSVEKAQSQWKKLAGGAGIAGIAIVGVGVAAKAAFSELQRGAELDVTASKFDNLTKSIGSTADTMLGRMNAATGGMISNTELMVGATTIMQGKLASTEDSVVRMSAVTGALGWDMGVLAQTINNQSVLRLDNLGLAVSDVVPRFKELQATMGDKEAFGLAVIEAGEASVALLGDRSVTTAGQIEQMTKAVTDARDAFSLGFARGAAEEVKLLGENAELSAAAFERAGSVWGNILATVVVDAFGAGIAYKQLDDALAAGIITQVQYTKATVLLDAGLIGAGQAVEYVNGKTEEFIAAGGQVPYTLAQIQSSAASADGVMLQYAYSVGVAADANRDFAASAGGFAGLTFAPIGPQREDKTEQRARNTYLQKAKKTGIGELARLDAAGLEENTRAMRENGAASANLRREGYGLIDNYNNLGLTVDKATELEKEFFGGIKTGAQSAKTAAEEAAAAIEELDAVTGSYFDQAFKRKKDFNPAELFYEQALSAGASADKLRALLIGSGLKSPEEADKIYQEALQRQQLAVGAQAFASQGGLSFEEAFKGGQGLTAADFSGATVETDNSRTVNVGGVTIYISGSANKKDLEMAIDSSFARANDAEGAAP